MHAGRNDEEHDRQGGHADEHRLAIRASRHQDADNEERDQCQQRPDDHGRDRADREGPAAGGGHHVAHPGRIGGDAVAIEGHQRPGIPGVHRQVRVAAGGLEDLLDEPRHRKSERQGQCDGCSEADETGRRDPDGPRNGGLPARGGASRRRTALASVATLRPEGTADRDGGHDRDKDAELGLDEGRDDGQHRRSFGPVPPQLAESEEQEHEAE